MTIKTKMQINAAIFLSIAMYMIMTNVMTANPDLFDPLANLFKLKFV